MCHKKTESVTWNNPAHLGGNSALEGRRGMCAWREAGPRLSQMAPAWQEKSPSQRLADEDMKAAALLRGPGGSVLLQV